MSVFPNYFCIQKSYHDYFIVLINIFLAKFCRMLVAAFFDLVKIRGKNQEVGFYYRGNSPASSSKYQHNNRNLSYCSNITIIKKHTIEKLLCIDSGPQFTNIIPKKVKCIECSACYCYNTRNNFLKFLMTGLS